MNETIFKTSTLPQNGVSFGIFQTQVLPELPEPSEYIKDILAACKTRIKAEPLQSNKRSRRKANTRRRLNGFIAFRAFYSRTVRDSQLQKHLSSLLGKAWKAEINRNVWEIYATLYNETGGDESFLNWLLSRLNLSNPTSVLVASRDKMVCRKTVHSKVEDIYLK